MAEAIAIKKEKIPYKTKIKFSNGIFQLGFRYNKNSDRILVDLFAEDGTEINNSERMIYGFPLFWIYQEDLSGNLNPDYPDKYIIPSSDDGTEKEPNLENISESVFLIIRSRGAAELEFDFDLWRE